MRNLEGKCDERDDFQILSLKLFVGRGSLKVSLSGPSCEGLETDSGTMEEQPAQVSCLGDKLPLFLLFFKIIYQFGKYWKTKALCSPT